jgi:hypothetical protein
MLQTCCFAASAAAAQQSWALQLLNTCQLQQKDIRQLLLPMLLLLLPLLLQKHSAAASKQSLGFQVLVHPPAAHIALTASRCRCWCFYSRCAAAPQQKGGHASRCYCCCCCRCCCYSQGAAAPQQQGGHTQAHGHMGTCMASLLLSQCQRD